MQILDHDIPLEAILDLPSDTAKTHPLLLILHGFTGFKEEAQLACLAGAARDAGFAALRPDLYGHGESGGAFRDHSLDRWLSNIRALLSFAESDGRFSSVILCGHSQGGLAALLAASQQPSSVRGLILLAPALRIPEQARRGTSFGLHFDPENIPDSLVVWDHVLGRDYFLSAQRFRTEDAYCYEGPVLFLHGLDDERVPAAVSADAAKRLKHAQAVFLPGEDHDFGVHPERMAAEAAAWLAQVIQSAEQVSPERSF